MLKASSVPKPTTALSVASMESAAPCSAQVGPYLAGAGTHATLGKRRSLGSDTSSERPPKRQHGVAAPGTPDVECLPRRGSHDYVAKVHSAFRPSAPESSRSTAQPSYLRVARAYREEQGCGRSGGAPHSLVTTPAHGTGAGQGRQKPAACRGFVAVPAAWRGRREPRCLFRAAIGALRENGDGVTPAVDRAKQNACQLTRSDMWHCHARPLGDRGVAALAGAARNC